jgi:hypothetical protein
MRNLILFLLIGFTVLPLIGCDVIVQILEPKTTVSTAPGRLGDISATLGFVSKGEDVVGRGDGIPNKESDAHLSLDLSMITPRTVVGLRLYSTNELWEEDHGSWWDTYPSSRSWILGVVKGSQLLNPHDESLSDRIVSIAHYDIYANGDWLFVKDRRFVLSIKFEEEWDELQIRLITP